MFDTYGLNIYPVLTNPEIRVDFVCPPGWNCQRPDETIIIDAGERRTHCDNPLECGPGVPVMPNNPNQCELNTYTVNQIIARGVYGLAPQLKVTEGNDEQRADCTDFGLADNGSFVVIAANALKITKPVPAVAIGGGTSSSLQKFVCGVAGPIHITHQFPTWLINREAVKAIAKAEANARAKLAAKNLFLSKVASGQFPLCVTPSCWSDACIVNPALWGHTATPNSSVTLNRAGNTLTALLDISTLYAGPLVPHNAHLTGGPLPGVSCGPYPVTFSFGLDLNCGNQGTVTAIFEVNGVIVRQTILNSASLTSCDHSSDTWANYTTMVDPAVAPDIFQFSLFRSLTSGGASYECRSKLTVNITADCNQGSFTP